MLSQQRKKKSVSHAELQLYNCVRECPDHAYIVVELSKNGGIESHTVKTNWVHYLTFGLSTKYNPKYILVKGERNPMTGKKIERLLKIMPCDIEDDRNPPKYNDTF